jgi:hypothetical protein
MRLRTTLLFSFLVSLSWAVENQSVEKLVNDIQLYMDGVKNFLVSRQTMLQQVSKHREMLQTLIINTEKWIQEGGSERNLKEYESVFDQVKQRFQHFTKVLRETQELPIAIKHLEELIRRWAGSGNETVEFKISEIRLWLENNKIKQKNLIEGQLPILTSNNVKDKIHELLRITAEIRMENEDGIPESTIEGGNEEEAGAIGKEHHLLKQKVLMGQVKNLQESMGINKNPQDSFFDASSFREEL